MQASAARDFLRVGITGGIGSGKTLVCSLFEKRGLPVISADAVAKEIMQADADLRRGLSAILGPSTYHADGTLDRAFVATKIFSDRALQRKVNRLVHPKVVEEIERRFAAMRESGCRIGVVEAALVYESGLDKDLDVVIVVDAPEATRIDRVVGRDAASPDEVRRRINAQLPSEQKAGKADFVIRNTGSLAELESSVQFLYTLLHTISGKR